jgi:hypothetical protein
LHLKKDNYYFNRLTQGKKQSCAEEAEAAAVAAVVAVVAVVFGMATGVVATGIATGVAADPGSEVACTSLPCTGAHQFAVPSAILAGRMAVALVALVVSVAINLFIRIHYNDCTPHKLVLRLLNEVVTRTTTI